MATDDKRRPLPKAARGADLIRQRTKPAGERPFDMWLQKQLHAMYDEIASEPLPNDLLGLIDRDAATSDGDDETGKPPAGGKKT
jgi:hypothetical protein